ncbi:hypothetical protein [Arenibaculum pallidiluteum]|uniref:hypothetical protein n=1 Tax=Arenibaculum pallidiluteum TaxID=2812559 RepID=UPI001A967F22|nr:hypothetical protein [Arenibaculum pallidiluteum]
MTEPQPQAPVLLFRHPYFGRRKAGREDLAWFGDAESFKRSSRGEIREKEFKDALLVDVTGMSWRIVDVHDGGGYYGSNLLARIWSCVMRGDNRLVRYELQPEGQMSFEAIRNRACASILGSPDVWCDWRLIGSKGRRSREVRHVLEAKAAKVRQAIGMRGLFAELDAIS